MESSDKVFRTHRALSWLCLLFFALIVWLATGLASADLAFFLLWGSAFGLLFLMHHLVARGARRRRPWAKTASTVVSALMLLGFPLGTLIGAYLLYHSLQDWGPQAADA